MSLILAGLVLAVALAAAVMGLAFPVMCVTMVREDILTSVPNFLIGSVLALSGSALGLSLVGMAVYGVVHFV